MPSKIICNVTSRETRVALWENNAITELFIELKSDQGLVGNIYKGRVTKVLPGMQVAFVDIGLPKAGFLYVADIDPTSSGFEHLTLNDDSTVDEDTKIDLAAPVSRQEHSHHIEDILQEGSEIMVQVSKDPMAAKGARITGYITLPGRYLVYMPTVDQVGVSRRIESEEEKKRLKEALKGLKDNGAGYIIRTAAEGKREVDFKRDIEFLDKLWSSIAGRYNDASSPELIYADLNMVQRSIRDLFPSESLSVIIDDKDEYDRTVAFCKSYLPDTVDKLELYVGKEPIFDAYGVEIEIERALGRKVWLKSGGYIVVDQTEALTAIDVNTGKFVGAHSPEDTILQTNLEAVKEIVYQLRLRNIGGLIILDLIDMERDESKEKVYSALEQALKNDRSRTNILKISELGLVEMTRKRVRESLLRTLSTTCPYCDGRGAVKSHATVLHELYREIRRVAGDLEGGKSIKCVVSPGVADLLFDEESEYLDSLEGELDIKVSIAADQKMHQERFLVTSG